MEKKNEKINFAEIIEKLKSMGLWDKKVMLPVILVAAILITMGIAMMANRKNKEQEEVQTNAQGQSETQGITVPDVLLEENAYPEVNELIMKYYKGLEEENADILTEIISPLTDDVVIHFTEWSKHVRACPTVNIYTKPGPKEDSFLAYVRVDVQIVGYDELVPGLNSFYICKNSAGNYYINMEEEISKEEADYIKEINMQDDVKDLNNKITAEFNQLVKDGSDAAQAFMNVDASITKGIQDVLAARQAAEQAENTSAEISEPQTKTVATEVKATAVVNMRSSDSEQSDKLGKAQIGDKFKVIEQRANGWSKLTDGRKEFFIKSEYLEVTAEETVTTTPEPAQTEVSAQIETPAQAETANAAPGKVTAKTTVNIRKSASETAEKLGKVYRGAELELIENQADGWSKVKYNGQTAYVKSEFVEKK